MRRSPVSILASTILVLLSMITMTWAVLSGGWTDGSTVLYLIVVAGVVEGVLVAQLLRHRVFELLLAPFLAYLIIIPATSNLLPAGIDGTGNVISKYLLASWQGIVSNDPWTFTVGLGTIIWAVSYNLAWLATREQRAAVGTLPAFGALGINALNAPLPGAVVAPTLLCAVFLLLVIASSQIGGLLQQWHIRRLPILPGLTRRFAAGTAFCVAALLCVAAVIPPVSTTDFSKTLFHYTHGPLGVISQTPQNVTVGFSPAVQPGGPLISKPTPVFTYSGNSSQTYFTVTVDGAFSQGTWNPGPPLGVPESRVPFPGPEVPRDRNPADGGVGAVTATVRDSIRYVAANPTGDTAFGIFPGDPDSSSLPGNAFGTDGFSGLLTVNAIELDSTTSVGASAAVSGIESTATGDQLRGAGTQYPDFARTYATFPLDSSDAQTISRLAQNWTSGTGNAYDAATAIEAHLRDPHSFTYTLNPPAAPSGKWPITYFLTSSKAGYCQYFASAMGAMLRAEGIPARLVSGFGPGSATGSDFTVTTSDAHVWVQAFFPNYGWINFEPTPPSVLGNYQTVPRGVDPTKPTPTPAPTATAQPKPTPRPTAHVAPTPLPTHAPGSATSLGPPSWLGPLALIVALVALVLGVTAGWLRNPKGVPAIWRRLRFLARLSGMRPMRASDTQLAYTRRWIEQLPGPVATHHVVGESLTDIAQLSMKHQYSRDGLAEPDHERMTAAWRGMLRAFPKLAWQRIANRRGGAANATE
jgi:transglutaminase-like putative cysteine protease